jgi:hypothetical protein
MVYALMQTFLSQVIEGDELYTKVGKNVPVDVVDGINPALFAAVVKYQHPVTVTSPGRDPVEAPTS